MPIYLAQPGVSSKEPWRHGLQVYERPFPINLELDNHDSSNNNNNNNDDHDRHQQSYSGIGGVTAAAAGGDTTNQQLRPTMRHDTTLSQSHSSLNNNEGPNHHHNSINESTATSANSSKATLSSAVAGMTSQQIIDNNNNSTSAQATTTNYLHKPKPLRRIRHSEIVLVDQCLIAYGRYWLRLKWPGEQGGHGGYVALYENNHHQGMKEGGEGGGGESSSAVTTDAALPGAGDDRNNNNIAMGIVASSSPVTTTSVMCTQTNVPYPTSGVLKLLPSYDDGLNNENNESSKNNNNNGGDEILISLETGEPVFCRICREGLHDVNTDYLETTTPPSSTQQQQSSSSSGVATNNAVDDEVDEGSPGPTLSGREGRSSGTGGGGRDVGVNAVETVTNTTTRNDISEETVGKKSSSLCPTSASNELSGGNGAVTIPPITRFHPSADNPLLAPCLCTGSMRFVHYLCVEQWRCRSRHPGARNGLNCETCNAEYTLPPPPSRPNRGGIDGVGNNNMMVDDDWLDAMPPHVLAALRRPHPWWQLGAAVVRRRWLRPIVPVLASPLVALYCKARRTLKKRGVSRRRWACSLCRRRARWKCVRCLRSYYCSRQCQNVSWHIVHKHVCYKPVRFWWSVVVYTLGTLILVPGIVKNFPIYDTSATLLPVNFVAMGNIAGGVASTLKRSSGIDIRGRILEISVILCTLFLTAVSSGIVRAYFGDSSQCWGVLASSLAESSSSAAVGTPPGPFIDSASNKAFSTILQYAQLYYRKWDFLCARAGILSRFICTPTDDGNADFATIGCSSPVRSINPQFYLEEENCRADIGMVVDIWVAACLVLFLEHLYRSYRVRRRVAVHLHRGRQRPHQD